MAAQTRSFLLKHWKQVVNILGKRDGIFAVIKRGSKLPTRKGWNQTKNGISARQAKKHLDAGDNITHLAGTGNVYAFDFDHSADRGYECPQLADGLYIHRENAPHKAKFIFQCDTPIPTRLRSRKHGIDLLGVNSNDTHWSCVIAGTHSSGAPILWGGTNVPVLSGDTVAALWEEWTEEDLFAPERAETAPDLTYASADLARLADALPFVDPHSMDYNAWIGHIAAAHDAFGDDALPLMVNWADGKVGEVEAKWKTFDREYNGRAATLDGIFYRARKGGWPDTWLQDRLAEYRLWLASPDAIEELRAAVVPDPTEENPEHTRKLFRNPERARKLLDTIFEKCEKTKGLRITPGYAYLAKQSGIAKGAIPVYLAKLFTGGYINLYIGAEDKPTVIELVLHNLNSYTPSGEAVQVVQNWNIYREFRADDVFLNGHAAYSNTHQRPALQPFGDNGLGALLALLDGPATVQEAADLIGYTYGAMSRVLRRFANRGVVSVATGQRNRKTYTLNEEWRAIIDADRPHMPTCGVGLFRNVEMLGNRVKQLRKRGQDERADLLEKEHKRLDDIASELRTRLCISVSVKPSHLLTEGQRQVLKVNRLKRVDKMGASAELRPRYRSETEEEMFSFAKDFMDQYRRWEYVADLKSAESAWDELNAWATMTRGSGWWLYQDRTEIVDRYREYKQAANYVPSMHWAGEKAVAA